MYTYYTLIKSISYPFYNENYNYYFRGRDSNIYLCGVGGAAASSQNFRKKLSSTIYDYIDASKLGHGVGFAVVNDDLIVEHVSQM